MKQQECIGQIMEILDDYGFIQGDTEIDPVGNQTCTWVVDEGTESEIEITIRAKGEDQ